MALWVLLAVAATALGCALVLRQNRRLAREIEKRRAAEEEAQRNSKELETFAYAISHDLKAPLRRIAGFSHIPADDHAAQLDAEGRGFLGRIEAGAAKMGPDGGRSARLLAHGKPAHRPRSHRAGAPAARTGRGTGAAMNSMPPRTSDSRCRRI
ncbi:MAG: hypothetical protein M5R42_04180 [Rhodocyclaceae bacterium]|nr:hypothetical protein [Rhodocyclaceae bacterium]